jgi:hypothetical protein
MLRPAQHNGIIHDLRLSPFVPSTYSGQTLSPVERLRERFFSNLLESRLTARKDTELRSFSRLTFFLKAR